MKITKEKLKQIIQEELSALEEVDAPGVYMHAAGPEDPRGTSVPLSTGALTFEQWGLEVLEHLPYLYEYWEGKFSRDSAPEGYVKWLTTPPDPESPYHPDSPDYRG